jgi:hypothetical protein
MASIVISSVTIPGWEGNTTGVQLRIYTNPGFTAQSGTLSPLSAVINPASRGTFFQSYACKVSSGELGIPQVQIDSTTDSPDNPDANYSAVLSDSTTGKLIQSFGTESTFTIPPSPFTKRMSGILHR